MQKVSSMSDIHTSSEECRNSAKRVCFVDAKIFDKLPYLDIDSESEVAIITDCSTLTT